jgi:hypothetical protein
LLPSLRRRAAAIPLFWRIPLAGWTAHAILSLPLKVATPFQRWVQVDPVPWLWVLRFTWLS